MERFRWAFYFVLMNFSIFVVFGFSYGFNDLILMYLYVQVIFYCISHLGCHLLRVRKAG